jgi:hypothetical protein
MLHILLNSENATPFGAFSVNLSSAARAMLTKIEPRNVGGALSAGHNSSTGAQFVNRILDPRRMSAVETARGSK